MAGVICVDFDGTVVEEDILAQLARRFAREGYDAAYEAYCAGRMSVEQMASTVLDLIEADEAEMRAFAVSVAKPRAGLLELADWAHWHDWRMAVVSDGLDRYVNPILDSIGIKGVSRHCGRTRFAYRWRVSYPSPRGVELQSGFKVSYVSAYRRAGDFVAWVGDGPSDIEPARECGVVFARDKLWQALKDEHPRVYPFETFHDVVAVLDREGARWLESFSSMTAGEA